MNEASKIRADREEFVASIRDGASQNWWSWLRRIEVDSGGVGSACSWIRLAVRQGGHFLMLRGLNATVLYSNAWWAWIKIVSRL